LLLLQLEHAKHLWRKSMGTNTWNTIFAHEISFWLSGHVQAK
jgi:hypothetical protein